MGQPPDYGNLAQASEEAAREVKATSNYLGSKAYRRQLTATLVEEALQMAVSRAGGAS
jgi:CO/xanthine dehydrogenase FAD-binding subunit